MKIGITGHTGGVGKCIADYFRGRGDQVIGYSRSTGYTLPADWKRITLDVVSQDCDVFVNCARVYGNDQEMSQALILHKLGVDWKGKDKRIINIGSISGRNPLTTIPGYTAQKAALRKLAENFQSRQIRPHIFHIDFGMLDTQSNAHEMARKMPPEDVVRVIDFYMNFPHDILDITFRHKDALCAIS